MLAPFLIFFLHCWPHFIVFRSSNKFNINQNNTSKHNMQFLKWRCFFMTGKQNPNPHGPVWKVFAPTQLKHNCGLSHLSSVFSSHIQAWLLPHLFAIKKSHRTCLTKWSRSKIILKSYTSCEIQRKFRNKWESIEIYQSGKGYKAISKPLDSSEPQWEPLSTNGENMEQWWPSQEWPADKITPRAQRRTHPRGHKRPHKQHLKNCRPHFFFS